MIERGDGTRMSIPIELALRVQLTARGMGLSAQSGWAVQRGQIFSGDPTSTAGIVWGCVWELFLLARARRELVFDF